MKLLKRIVSLVPLLLRKDYFGFIYGNDYLTDFHSKKIRTLIQSPSSEWQTKYEKELAVSLGHGNVVTYAAGRMAFYSILKTLDLQKKDEVILAGFTCSVMVNAIIRIGATPIFSDIDPETFGSSPMEISKLITKQTKVIVAQHSFGIPCEIDEIQKIAIKNKIYLIEDCALSFLSKYKGVTLGNWGDVAIFSSDHSKPLNTLIGGFAYTNNFKLYQKLKKEQFMMDDIPIKQQYKIYQQIIFESKYYKPELYRFLKFRELIEVFFKKFIKKASVPTFLIEDSSSLPHKNKFYSYPSKFPLFLSYLGLLELERYKASIELRRLLMNNLLKALSQKHVIPSSYINDDNYIIPLRFVFCSESIGFYNKISKFIDNDWFWFKKPIEASTEDLVLYGYKPGSCPIAERVGKTIINIPCIHYKNSTMIKYINKI